MRYQTTKPGTPNDIIGLISSILGQPSWQGDLSNEYAGMGVISRWESEECGAAILVSRVATRRMSKMLMTNSYDNLEADTEIAIVSLAEMVEHGKGVLD